MKPKICLAPQLDQIIWLELRKSFGSTFTLDKALPYLMKKVDLV